MKRYQPRLEACKKNDGKLLIRLQFVAEERLELVELDRRVHIGEEPIAVAERFQVAAVHYSHPHILEQPGHRQIASIEAPRHRVPAGARVHGAERIISAFGPRHDDIGVLCFRNQASQRRRGYPTMLPPA
jgi:hypothetical protein